MRDPVKSLAACDSSFAAAVVEMSQRLPRSQLGCGCSCIKCSGNDGTPLPAAVVWRGNAQAADQSFSLLTWRILTLRTCVGGADNDFGSWGRHGRCRECRSSRTHGRPNSHGWENRLKSGAADRGEYRQAARVVTAQNVKRCGAIHGRYVTGPIYFLPSTQSRSCLTASFAQPTFPSDVDAVTQPTILVSTHLSCGRSAHSNVPPAV
jgi:hypothetical protein